ncbi:MAG: RNA polymerase sigma factor (TIGR02999 family) [Verrucomicrobiales bacterium]|jgi:RNA polymerase sigma factor (TIGR02999 family)
MNDVTLLLDAAKNGDQAAAEELLTSTYRELRLTAARMMAREQEGHTLQPTALTHEAYLRLLGPNGEQLDWDSRGHLFAAAAESMRRILIDHARKKQAVKRGGDLHRTTWDEAKFDTGIPSDEIIAVNDALEQLEQNNPGAAKIVKLRYFAGLTIPEVASALGIAPRTVNRTWQGAKKWLYREISDENSA